MTFQNPELLLARLNKALRELRAASRVLGDNDLEARMLPVMRRLALPEIMGDQWLIAVAGLQGAGKTTLIRTAYGLADDDPWLPNNEGQGETQPIIVEEVEGLNRPRGFGKMLVPAHDDRRQFDFKLEPLQADEFVAACRGGRPDVLLPVLQVPRRYFHRPGQALLLLPGYEKRTANNASWQDFMRQALIGASGCVLVTNPTLLSDYAQQEILQDTLSNELRTARPVVVIMETENLAGEPDRLEHLRTAAMEVFQLEGADAAQRVVFAGKDTPGAEPYSQAWLSGFGALLRDMSLSGTGVYQAQLSRLEQALTDDLNGVLREVRTKAALFGRSAGGESGAQEAVDGCLSAFDEALQTLTTAHQQAVAAIVGSHYRDAWERLEASLVANHEGVLNKIVNTFDTVTETQVRLNNDVETAWGSQDTLLRKYAHGVGELTARTAGPTHPLASLDGTLAQRLGYHATDAGEKKALFADEGVQANLRALMLSQAGDVSPGTDRQLERTARLLPAIALEYMRISAAFPALARVDIATLQEFPDADLNKAAANLRQQFGEFSDSSLGILKGIAAVLAIDVAADGHADIIDAVLGTGAAAAGWTVGSAVTGLVAIGYVAQRVAQDVRRYDGQVRGLANKMLQDIRNEHVNHFTTSFEDVMQRLRARLREGLRQRYGLDQRLMHLDRLAKSIADVFTLQQELLSHLAASGRAVPLFVNGAS